jgi:hypothetical protein
LYIRSSQEGRYTIRSLKKGPGSPKGVMKDEGVQNVRGDGTSGGVDKRMHKKI